VKFGLNTEKINPLFSIETDPKKCRLEEEFLIKDKKSRIKETYFPSKKNPRYIICLIGRGP